jgi:hypothetical protein
MRPFSNTLLCYPAEIDQPKVSGTAHPDSSNDSSNITKRPAIDWEKGDWDVMEIPIKRTYRREDGTIKQVTKGDKQSLRISRNSSHNLLGTMMAGQRKS